MYSTLDIDIETDFPEQLSALPYKKKRNHELSQKRRKRVQQDSFQKKEDNSDRAYHLQVKEIPDNE